MSLVKTGPTITDASGGVGGVYFHRDKSGLHLSKKPRVIQRRSPAQDLQRHAFTAARIWSRDNRTVSYLMYLFMNGIEFTFDCFVTGNPNPDCTGKYIEVGTLNDRPRYERVDGVWRLGYWIPGDIWVISPPEGEPLTWAWSRDISIGGIYTPRYAAAGNPFLTRQVTPPPADFQIPRL